MKIWIVSDKYYTFATKYFRIKADATVYRNKMVDETHSESRWVLECAILK